MAKRILTNVGLWLLGLVIGAALGALVGYALATGCQSQNQGLACLGYLWGGPLAGAAAGAAIGTTAASAALRRGVAWPLLACGLAALSLIAPLPPWLSLVAAAVAAPALATYLVSGGRHRPLVGALAGAALLAASVASGWAAHQEAVARVRAGLPEVIVVDAMAGAPTALTREVRYPITTADGLRGDVWVRPSADVDPTGAEVEPDLWTRTTSMNGQPQQLVTVRRGDLTALVTLATPDAGRAIALARTARRADASQVVPWDPFRRP